MHNSHCILTPWMNWMNCSSMNLQPLTAGAKNISATYLTGTCDVNIQNQRELHVRLTSVNEVPEAWMNLQPLTVGSEVALIARGFADSLVSTGATFWGLEGAKGKLPLLPSFIVVATGKASRCSPVWMCVDTLSCSCNMQAGKMSASQIAWQ